MRPKVSIVVPAYNAEKTIERCISSVLKQSYDCLELIIVNDGSKDATEEICKRFLDDARIKLINKHNAGVSAARNTGVTSSTGKYIVFLDSDDTLETMACSRFVEEMEKGVDLCISDLISIINDIPTLPKPIEHSCRPGIYNREIFLQNFGPLYQNHHMNSPWAKCYKKERIKELFSQQTSIGEDLLFNLSYLRQCDSISVIKDRLYGYYIQNGYTLSSSFRMDLFDMMKYVYKETETHCQSLGLSWPIQEVDEKYVLDMTVLFERFARCVTSCKLNKEMREMYHTQELAHVFAKTSVSGGGKFKIEKFFLEKQWFGLFCAFARSTAIVKKCLIKIVK